MINPIALTQNWTRGLSPNLQGVIWMLLSSLSFTVHLCYVKILSADFAPGELALIRALAGLAIVSPVLLKVGGSALKISQPGLILFRGLIASAGFYLSFAAVANMPMAQFNAISFSRPLFTILLAALLLKEIVGPRRWVATFVGFIGVLIIVQPNSGFDKAAILAIASSACIAGSIVLVKSLTRLHSTITLMIYANILTAIFMLPMAMADWRTPGSEHILPLAIMVVTGTAAQGFYINAMSVGEASFLSSIDFLRLPMTISADWIVFAALPTIWLWPGAGLIIGATLYISFREAQESRRAKSEAASDTHVEPSSSAAKTHNTSS